MNTSAFVAKERSIWIIGAGTFAVKLSTILDEHGLFHGFVDRHRTQPLCNRAVLPLNDALDSHGIYLVAVSFVDIANEIKLQLVGLGICASRIILLLEESSINVLDLMLAQDIGRALSILEQGIADFCQIEQVFFAEQYQSLNVASSKKKVAFCYIGNGGGFRKHVQSLPDVVAKHYQVKTFSDQMNTDSDRNEGYCIMSELTMMQNYWPDYVVNPHFFECLPASIPN